MSRSKWKGPFFAPVIQHKVFSRINSRVAYKVFSRSSTIPAKLLDQRILVHNGQHFSIVTITREKFGYKFGMFALTRRHTKKEKVIVKKK